jgi:DNA-binding transcriptional LysR family regulator
VHWDDLKLFVTVAQSGTVRGAAHRLKVDASTVSRRIAALEQGVGARLFERTSGGLRLTSAGKAVLQSGEKVDSEIQELARRLVGHDGRLEGVVRVTFPGSLTRILHTAMASFVERHPAIEMELLTADALLDVDGRQADVAVRVMGQPPEHLVGRRVGSLAGAVYASRDYLERRPLPLDSREHSWVEWDARLATKPAFRWLSERFPERRVVARGLSTADVTAAVVAGAGMGALPCVVGDGEPTLVRLFDAPKETWSSVWLLTHRELKPAARVRVVMSHLVESLRAERWRIEGRRERARGRDRDGSGAFRESASAPEVTK